MPWTTPTLREVRSMVRDDITASLSGVTILGNSVLRVVADATAGLSHLVLRYIDWLSRQFLPDTAEADWLDRHGDIWLVNADNSVGRKSAAYSSGTVSMTGVNGTIVASGTPLLYGPAGVGFQTTEQITLGTGATTVSVLASDPGAQGNIDAGETMGLVDPIGGVDSIATVISISGGTDEETDDELRARVLFRIRQPPMGGDSDDYVRWCTDVAGVTRAWSSNEMGIGTIMIRFMMDDLRAGQGGFPNNADILSVTSYIDSRRPVAIKDRFVQIPVSEPINFTIFELDPDDPSTRAAIEQSVRDMLRDKAAPAHMLNGIRQEAQTIYAAWVSDAISSVPTVNNFTLLMDDHPMPHNGNLAVLGTVLYDTAA